MSDFRSLITLGLGVVAIAIAATQVDGIGRLALLVPLGVLLGGLRWAALSPEHHRVRVTRGEAPTELGPMPGNPSAARVPTAPPTSDHTAAVLPPPPASSEPTPPAHPAAAGPIAVTSADRDAAARTFDLDLDRVDGATPAFQCPNCGRYWSIKFSNDGSRFRCSACAIEQPFDGAPRVTFVRMFGLPPEPADLPTIPPPAPSTTASPAD